MLGVKPEIVIVPSVATHVVGLVEDKVNVGVGLTVTTNVCVSKHTGSGVVYVIVNVPPAGADAKLITPVLGFTVKPAGDTEKVPPGTPVIVGEGWKWLCKYRPNNCHS